MIMVKVFVCEMCGAELKAKSVEELLKKVATHAKNEHNMIPTPEILEIVESKIRDE